MLRLYDVLQQFVEDDEPKWAADYYEEVQDKVYDTEDAAATNNEGAIDGCVEYNAAIAPMTCKSFLALNRITIAQLFKWNSAVGADCSNLWLGHQYCVSTDAVPTDIASSTDTPTTTPTPTKTTSATPSPTAPSALGLTHPGTARIVMNGKLLEAVIRVGLSRRNMVSRSTNSTS
ncbi:hypothetical protein E8E11_000017, partial [Didymella keratinophila]